MHIKISADNCAQLSCALPENTMPPSPQSRHGGGKNINSVVIPAKAGIHTKYPLKATESSLLWGAIGVRAAMLVAHRNRRYIPAIAPHIIIYHLQVGFNVSMVLLILMFLFLLDLTSPQKRCHLFFTSSKELSPRP